MFFVWHLKLYQMDVAHAILFAKTIDISRVTADYSSAKFEIISFIGRRLKLELEKREDGKENVPT